MATILENESAWSTNHDLNANSDTGINWAENQDSASVNNSARGMMAARAKARLDQGGALIATGGANALTVTTQQVLSAPHLAGGQRLLVRASATNTSATVTLSVDGLTPAPVKRIDGSALSIGSITNGMALDLIYNPGLSEWRCLGISSLAGGGHAAFSAHKGGTNQSIGSTGPVQVTFTTELFDVGLYYNPGGSTWTPPAGIVSISTGVLLTSFDTTTTVLLLLYKNGVAHKAMTITNTSTGQLTVIDQADGADVYKIYVDSVSDASYTVSGSSTLTFFQGAVL
jgi:hypothetical protein